MLRFIVSDVKIPIAILGAELDHISPAEQLKQLGKKLSEKSEVSPTKKCSTNHPFSVWLAL